MSNELYEGGKRDSKKYKGEIPYSFPDRENFKKLYTKFDNPSFDSKNDKEDWEKLRDMLRNPFILDGAPEVFMYADRLAMIRKMGFIEALEIASDQIEKFSEKLNKEYPSDDPESNEMREKKYYSKLLKLFKKLDIL